VHEINTKHRGPARPSVRMFNGRHCW
jgi:hypothetical protein